MGLCNTLNFCRGTIWHHSSRLAPECLVVVVMVVVVVGAVATQGEVVAVFLGVVDTLHKTMI